jgi:hypothetical protein
VPTTSWTWASGTRTVTQTTTAANEGIEIGDAIAMSGFTNAQACLNGTFTVTAATSTGFSYVVPSGTTCNPGASGGQNGTGTIRTVASDVATGTATVTTVTAAATTGTVEVPAYIPQTTVSPVGTVSFTGTVAPTAITGTNLVTAGAVANATIGPTGSGWKSTHPPGMYMVDAVYGTPLEIDNTVTNTNFAGYTFVAPEILISGSGNTFSNFASAPQTAVLYAYNPNGDAVHESAVSYITGGIFCGPPEPNVSNPNPVNKCWFGGNGSTFHGILQAWRIEWKLSNSTFDGTGPKIGGQTSTGTSTVSGQVTTYPDQVTTVGTGSALDE